jgi:hypothetical protein
MEINGERLIRAVVRGEKSWHDLSSLGIAILPLDTGFEVLNNDQIRGAATASDVAAGVVHFSNEGEALREWASILLGAASFVDLSLNTHPRGEELLDILWDLSFGEPLSRGALSLASQIAAN